MSSSLQSAAAYRRHQLPAGQSEFPLHVAVCAWCRPVEEGEGLGALSHGICPRHFRSLEWQMRGIVLKRRVRSRRRVPEAEALLPL